MSPRPSGSTTPPRVDTSRIYTAETTIHGRHVTRGTELAADGIRGRVAFIAHVRHVDGVEWLDVVDTRGRSRSIRPDKIRTVHRRVTGILGDAQVERRQP
jgi:hypothetical protein